MLFQTNKAVEDLVLKRKGSQQKLVSGYREFHKSAGYKTLRDRLLPKSSSLSHLLSGIFGPRSTTFQNLMALEKG